MLLVDFLRDDLSLTGTHVGCEHGVCGACTIMLNGEAARSCIMFAVAGQRRGDRHRRRSRQGRHAASAAAGLPRASRPAMRLLHARHADRRAGLPARQSVAQRGRGARGPVRGAVPLHRLPEHRHGRDGRRPKRCGGQMPGDRPMARRRATVIVGQSILRREDRRLLTGRGQFVADLKLPDTLHAVFVRSQVAHARIRSVDLSRAAAAPGVVYALTGAELRRSCRRCRTRNCRCRGNGPRRSSTLFSTRSSRCWRTTRCGTSARRSP